MAMSHSRAVLVSDLPPMLEIVTADANGFIFKSGNADSLAQQLFIALGDSAKLGQIGRNAAAQMKEENDWNKIGKLTADVYRRVLKL